MWLSFFEVSCGAFITDIWLSANEILPTFVTAVSVNIFGLFTKSLDCKSCNMFQHCNLGAAVEDELLKSYLVFFIDD